MKMENIPSNKNQMVWGDTFGLKYWHNFESQLITIGTHFLMAQSYDLWENASIEQFVDSF